MQEGDSWSCTRIDRLARSMKDLQDIVHELKAKGVALKATEQPIDTSTAAGKAFLDMLGVFAEFETNLRKERQLEGIAKAKLKAFTPRMAAARRRSTPRRCVNCMPRARTCRDREAAQDGAVERVSPALKHTAEGLLPAQTKDRQI